MSWIETLGPLILTRGDGREGEVKLGSRACVPGFPVLPILTWLIKESPQPGCCEVVSQVRAGESVEMVDLVGQGPGVGASGFASHYCLILSLLGMWW